MAVQEYKMVVDYHVLEKFDMTILAPSEAVAIEIATYSFRKAHTEKCILDDVRIVK